MPLAKKDHTGKIQISGVGQATKKTDIGRQAYNKFRTSAISFDEVMIKLLRTFSETKFKYNLLRKSFFKVC